MLFKNRKISFSSLHAYSSKQILQKIFQLYFVIGKKMSKDKNRRNQPNSEECKQIVGWNNEIDDSEWNQSLLRILEKKITLHESDRKQKNSKTIKKNNSQTLPSVSMGKQKKYEPLQKEKKISSIPVKHKQQSLQLKTQSEPFRQMYKHCYKIDERLQTQLFNLNGEKQDFNHLNKCSHYRNKHVQSHNAIRIFKIQQSPQQSAKRNYINKLNQNNRISLNQMPNTKERAKRKEYNLNHKKNWKDYFLSKNLEHKKRVTREWIRQSPIKTNFNQKKVNFPVENNKKMRGIQAEYFPFRKKKQISLDKRGEHPEHYRQKTQDFTDDHLQAFTKQFTSLQQL